MANWQPFAFHNHQWFCKSCHVPKRRCTVPCSVTLCPLMRDFSFSRTFGSDLTYRLDKFRQWIHSSRFTIRNDACLISRVNAQACLMSWPIAYSQGGVKLVNVALLSLMRRVWMYVALLSYRMNSSAPLVGRLGRVTREAGRVGLMGRDRGIRKYLVTLYLNYLHCLAQSQCFSRRIIQICMVTGRQPFSTHHAVGPGRT